MLNVESIQNGVVIDHIPAGKGMDIYRLLELESKTQSVALLQSVKSQKYGCKDLIKRARRCRSGWIFWDIWTVRSH